MRNFKTGETITVEPWRAASFPVIKDLVVDRSAFDKIIQAGGFITAPTGSGRDANEILVPKPWQTRRSTRRPASVAGVRGGVSQRRRAALYGGQARPLEPPSPGPAGTLEPHDRDGRHDGGILRELYELRGVRGGLPKGISIDLIAKMNRDYLRAKFKDPRSTVRAETAEAAG